MVRFRHLRRPSVILSILQTVISEGSSCPCLRSAVPIRWAEEFLRNLVSLQGHASFLESLAREHITISPKNRSYTPWPRLRDGLMHKRPNEERSAPPVKGTPPKQHIRLHPTPITWGKNSPLSTHKSLHCGREGAKARRLQET